MHVLQNLWREVPCSTVKRGVCRLSDYESMIEFLFVDACHYKSALDTEP